MDTLPLDLSFFVVALLFRVQQALFIFFLELPGFIVPTRYSPGTSSVFWMEDFQVHLTYLDIGVSDLCFTLMASYPLEIVALLSTAYIERGLPLRESFYSTCSSRLRYTASFAV